MELKDDGFFEEIQETENPIINEKEAPVSASKEEILSSSATEERVLPAVKLPLPEKDFDKNGRVKKVRGRMLGKLLKSELKHYVLLTLCFMGLLIITGIFCGVGLRKMGFADDPTENTPFFDIVSIASLLLFIGCCVGALVFTSVYPIARYEKNFFQSEGYLTFSIPASMEEHIFAKRIAAVLCTFAMAIVLILSVFLALLIGEGSVIFDEILRDEIFALQSGVYMPGGHAVAYVIESCISAIVGCVMLPSIYAVFTCLLSKGSGKRKTGTTILLVFIGVAILDSVSASFLTVESVFPQTVTWVHILTCLGIVAQAAITVGCICFEIWYLKHKLDLK